jgi:hypothetical protein
MKAIGRWTCFAMVVTSTLVASGCSSKTNLVEVTGTVTRNGKAVPNLTVHFVPETGRPSEALTNDKGEFKLKYDNEHDGASIGKHTVWVEVRARNPKEQLDMSVVIKQNPDLQPILDKYGDQKKSPLTIDIAANQPPVELKLD